MKLHLNKDLRSLPKFLERNVKYYFTVCPNCENAQMYRWEEPIDFSNNRMTKSEYHFSFNCGGVPIERSIDCIDFDESIEKLLEREKSFWENSSNGTLHRTCRGLKKYPNKVDFFVDWNEYSARYAKCVEELRKVPDIKLRKFERWDAYAKSNKQAISGLTCPFCQEEIGNSLKPVQNDDNWQKSYPDILKKISKKKISDAYYNIDKRIEEHEIDTGICISPEGEKIISSRENLTEYLGRLSSLENDIESLHEWLSQLYAQKPSKYAAVKYHTMSVEKILRDNLAALEDKCANDEWELELLHGLVEKAPCCYLPEKPQEPELEKPGFFNRKKIESENRTKIFSYKAKLEEYEKAATIVHDYEKDLTDRRLKKSQALKSV